MTGRHVIRRVYPIPPDYANMGLISFPPDILAKVAPHAKKRGITINEVIRLIVYTTVNDEMVDAVLDDGQ